MISLIPLMFLPLIVLFLGSLSLGQTNFSPTKKFLGIASSRILVASALLFHGQPSLGEDEYFGDTSTSVGTIDINIFSTPATREEKRLAMLEKLQKKTTTKEQEQESISPGSSEWDQFLNLVPSWKYYKIISEEYSKRGLGFDPDASPNVLAPLL